MDTLRLMLLSLLIGVSVSTSANYTNEGLPVEQVLAFQTGYIQSVTPTPQIIYVTPAPTPKPTQKPAASTSGIGRELYKGLQGDDVRAVQRLLSNLGYKITVDGVFGTQMRSVVIEFQRNNGLKADGIVGSRTYRKLTSSSAVGPGQFTNRTTLSYGMKGPDVEELQLRLKALGYYFDLCSGNYLTNTRNAVKWFQQVNGLPADGIAGPVTQSRLYSSAAIPASHAPFPTIPPTPVITRTLYQGMSGTDVGYVQQRLKDLGYYSGAVTNYFGPETFSAVRLFQIYNNLVADGVVGAATRNRLFNVAAVPYPGTPTPTPSPGATPTPKPAEAGEVCPYCSQIVLAGEAAKHKTPAFCGAHMSCVPGDHIAKGDCGKHFKCDGKDHTAAPCGIQGHYMCDNLSHTEMAACGVHRKCESGNHTLHGCGITGHYQCSIGGDHGKLACGLHYACDSAILPTDPAHGAKCTVCGKFRCETGGSCPLTSGNCIYP